MDERYFLYFEEIDWAMQARGRFSTGFAADAVVYHKEGGSIGSSRELARRSAFSEYYLARSKMFYGRKHRSEEHTSELQSLMRMSYAYFCSNKTTKTNTNSIRNNRQSSRSH